MSYSRIGIRRLCAVLYCLSFVLMSFAQQEKALPVRNIVFEGNKKTKATYLQRFLQTQSGAIVSQEILAEDVQRLKNLWGVADASTVVDTIDAELLVTFTIKESITFAPLVNFGGVRGNIWYQFGFTDINWLGRGMQLTTFYQNIDQRHNFSIYYRLPYWRGSRWGSSISFLRFASTEPLFFNEGTVYYDYENLSFGGTGIYEVSRHHFLELGGTYFVERYQKTDDQDLEVTPGPDQLTQPKFLFKFIHQIRRINYDFYHLDGFALMTNVQTVYNFEENDWFHIFLSDLTYFQRLSFNGNLAFRLRVGISTNISTPFAPFVLDSHINIRGSGNRIDRGTATLILNTEYRQRFFDYRNFAGQLVVFSDLGTWRNPGGSFDDLVDENNIRHFVGLGFRIIYKKAFNAIFRLDYGVDVRNTNERGLVLGIGQYF